MENRAPTQLRDMLNAALASADAEAGALQAREGGQVARVPTSETVLDVDRWSIRTGKELASEWDAMHDDKAHAPYDGHVAADSHRALFHPQPKRNERPAEEGRAEWFRTMMDSDDYRRLHGQTCLNDFVSRVAAKTLTDQWREYAAEHAEPGPGDPRPGSDGEPFRDVLDRIRSTSRALKAATDTASTATEAQSSLGIGDGDGGGTVDAQTLAQQFKRIRGSDFLRDLMQQAGRMRRVMQSARRQRVRHGRDDVVGVELSGDVARLIPSELAQLASDVPELELLALDRVARRQAMSRQQRGTEQIGRGPIVLVIDESGSMEGDAIIAAKAIALAFVWLAKQQNRWVACTSFGKKNGYTRTCFKAGEQDPDKLLDWLEHFFGGGTDLGIPFTKLPEDWPAMQAEGLKRGKTDVIVITDGQVHLDARTRQGWLDWSAAEQVTTYGVIIGGTEGGILGELCARYWCVPDLNLDMAGELFGAV